MNDLVVKDWRQLSGGVDLTYDKWREADVRADENCFFIFLWRESIFFFNQTGKPFSPLWNQDHSEAVETQYMSTVHHWWDAQSKQTR